MNKEEKYHFEATNGKSGEPKILILENGEIGGEIVGEVSASLAVVGYAGINGWAKPGEVYSWLRGIAMDIVATQGQEEIYIIQVENVDQKGNLISDYEELKQKK